MTPSFLLPHLLFASPCESFLLSPRNDERNPNSPPATPLSRPSWARVGLHEPAGRAGDADHGCLRSQSERDQPATDAKRHGLGSATRSQLLENRGDVKLHSVSRNAQAVRDHLIADAFRHHLEDLQLAGCQRSLTGLERRGRAGSAKDVREI